MNQETQKPQPSPESPSTRATEFSNWLEALLRANEQPGQTQFAGENTRKILADLRSGTNRTRDRLWPYLAPFLLEYPRASDDWFFTVGALAGWHPKARTRGVARESLGQTARALKERTDSSGRVIEANSDSLNTRFAALLASHERDLDEHLRRIVGLLRAGDIAVDYRTLLHDLVVTGWHHPERWVQQKWARDFYRSPRDNAPGDASDEAPSTSELSSEL